LHPKIAPHLIFLKTNVQTEKQEHENFRIVPKEAPTQEREAQLTLLKINPKWKIWKFDKNSEKNKCLFARRIHFWLLVWKIELAEMQIFNRPVERLEHKADVARIELLMR